MIEALLRLIRSIPGLLYLLLQGLWRIAVISADFILQTFRAHYNVAGQYTAPLEQELLGMNPDQIPEPPALNILGQIALFPVVIFAWICSLVLFPLVYNSIQSLVSTFKSIAGLPLQDLPEENQLQVRDSRALYRFVLYGILGLLPGAFFGSLVAIAITLVRGISNTLKNFVTAFVMVLNTGLSKYRIPEPKFEESHTFFKLLGSAGYVIGGLLGAVGLGFTGLGRLIIHSWKSALQLVGSAVNLVRKEPLKTHLGSDKRHWGWKIIVGLPGLALAIVPAFLAFSLAWIERTVIESAKALKSVFVSAVNVALHKDYEIQTEDPELKGRDYIFAFPGWVLGFIGGAFGYALVGLGRVISNSWESFLHVFAIFTNAALDKKQEIQSYGLSKDSRGPRLRYGLGGPGFIPGVIAGIFGFALAGTVRLSVLFIVNSWKTAIQTVNSAINLVRKESLANHLLSDDGRAKNEQLGFGIFGLILGGAAGILAFSGACLERAFLESRKVAAFLSINIWNGILPRSVENKTEFRELDSLFGLSGYPLGLIAGILGFIAIGFGRMVSNFDKSFINLAASMLNLILAEEDQITRFGLKQDEEKRKPADIYGFGVFGLAFGFIPGLLGMLAVFTGRTLVNSWKTGLQTLASIMNTVRRDPLSNHLAADKSRNSTLKLGFGAPGLVLAGLMSPLALGLALTERSLIASWERFIFTMIYAWNLALPEKQGWPNNLEHNTADKILGCLGFIPGFILGGAGAVVIGLGRMFTNSALTAMQLAITITNTVLEKEIPGYDLNRDERSVAEKFLLGAPGLVFGFAAGIAAAAFAGTGRVIVNSWKAMVSITIMAINLVRKESIPQPYMNKDIQNPWLFYIGLPGTIAGFFAGMIAFAAAVVERSFIESWKSGKTVAITVMNTVSKPKIIQDNENRQPGDSWGFGFPGRILGFIAGLFALVPAAIDRIVRESWKSSKEVFVKVVNLILPEDIVSEPEARENTDRLIYGAPGRFVGLLAGSIAFAGILFARIIVESGKTLVFFFGASLNLGLSSEDQFVEQPDQRKKLHVGFGAPGIFLGVMTGLFGLATVIAGRIISNSLKLSLAMAGSAVNLVRKDPVSYDLDSIKPYTPWLGLPGIAGGLVLGTLGFTAACLEKAALESEKSARYFTTKIVNKILPANYKIDESKIEEAWAQRSVMDLFFGATGMIPGIVGGVCAFLFIAQLRIGMNSIESFAYAFAEVVNAGLDDAYKLQTRDHDENLKRPREDILGYGLPGLATGYLAGAAGYIVVAFGQMISHSINSGVRTFREVANRDCGDTPRISIDAYKEADQRSWILKAAGFPGVILGATAGACVLAVVYTGKFLENNYISMITLGGSLLNAAFGRVLFGGLASDTRDAPSRATGLIGYSAALAILPLALMISALRVVIPSILVLSFAALGSPIVALVKWWRLYNEPRFENAQVQDATKLQRIKNLYSALDAWGYFPEDQPIADLAAGNKGKGTFIRKSFSFDQASMTECILEGIFNNLNRNENLNVREAVREHFDTKCCPEVPETEAQINAIATFIENYLEGKTTQVPKTLYSRYRNGFSNTFFGIQKNRMLPAEEEQASSDYIPDTLH